ncbi:MAG: hypothetical protein M3O61_05945 [Gemmatimonadota bacterium]|nr:hypothetical protein [Gemmatimonadota bacterium]
MPKRPDATRNRLSRSAEVAAIFVGALALRSLNLAPVPGYDELYHMLAARSWALDGTLAIADGTYRRASLFTIATGMMFSLFGESVTVARVIPIVAGSLLVALVFWWTRSVAGRLSAWIAALLLCFAPDAISLSRFIRFYSLHALLFFLGAIGVFALVTRPQHSSRIRFALMIMSTIAFALAMHLQSTTLIGLAGLCVWLIVVAGPNWVRQIKARPAAPRIALACAVIALLAFFTAVQTGYLAHQWDRYNRLPLWNEGTRVAFYHWRFLAKYATLWSLLPVAILVAIARRPQAGFFCATLVVIGLIALSLGANRGDRYIFYLTPFIYVLWAIAIAELVPVVRRLSRDVSEQFLPSRMRAAASLWVQWLTLGSMALFLVAGNRAVLDVFRAGPFPRLRGSVDWPAASVVLRPIIRETEVVVTTNALGAIYYLDRYDFEVSANHLSEIKGGKEFSLDHRTGRPVISAPESIDRIVSCYSSGLFVTEKGRWNNERTGIGRAAANQLLVSAEPVALDPRWLMLAFKWKRATEEPISPECATIRRLTRNRVAARVGNFR